MILITKVNWPEVRNILDILNHHDSGVAEKVEFSGRDRVAVDRMQSSLSRYTWNNEFIMPSTRSRSPSPSPTRRPLNQCHRRDPFGEMHTYHVDGATFDKLAEISTELDLINLNLNTCPVLDNWDLEIDERPGFSYIYIIRQRLSDYYKIGYSCDPFNRLKCLQTGNPNRLEITTFMRIPGANVLEVEQRCHEYFSRANLNNNFNKEWFKFTGELPHFDGLPVIDRLLEIVNERRI